MIFEICVDSVDGVRAARDAGAQRVELCADLIEGGITPSRGLIRQARRVDGIGLNVIIRPRGGDFLFDDDEVAAMEADIDTAKAEGADGLVIGLLTEEARIDVARTRRLVACARPASVTFHRAFDLTPDPHAALDELIALGIDRVLTSGQAETVLDGLPLIADLLAQAAGRIVVMPGGGITERNIARIVAGAPVAEIHFAALTAAASRMRRVRDHVFMGGGAVRLPEDERLVTSGAVIAAVMATASAGRADAS